MGDGGLEGRLGGGTLGIGVDPLVIPRHRSKLIDHLLADMEPFTDVSLFTDTALQLGIECGSGLVQLDGRLLHHGRLAIGNLGDGDGLLLLTVLGFTVRVEHAPQQRMQVCLLLKLTPVVADRRREPILELKGVLRQNFALVLQKIDNFHLPIPIRFNAYKRSNQSYFIKVTGESAKKSRRTTVPRRK